jgi:hypothetical protein
VEKGIVKEPENQAQAADKINTMLGLLSEK